MQDLTNSWNAPGEFVTLVGYEWAGNQVHRNVYTARPRLRLFRGMYGPESDISPDLTLRWEDPDRPVGEVYYYVHVVQQDGHHAWSSPI